METTCFAYSTRQAICRTQQPSQLLAMRSTRAQLKHAHLARECAVAARVAGGSSCVVIMLLHQIAYTATVAAKSNIDIVCLSSIWPFMVAFDNCPFCTVICLHTHAVKHLRFCVLYQSAAMHCCRRCTSATCTPPHSQPWSNGVSHGTTM